MVYSRNGKVTYSDSSNSSAIYNFGPKEIQKYLLNSYPCTNWTFMDPNVEIEPYYTSKKESDHTLVFESRFESGNLNYAIKLSNNEYMLTMQNDTLTKGHTQCNIRIRIY